MGERFVDVIELYPFYTLNDRGYRKTQPHHEFTDAELADYARVAAEFAAWQKRLEAICDGLIPPGTAAKPDDDASIRRHNAMDRLDASIHALCAETGMTEDELRRLLTEDETPNDGHGAEEYDRERE